MKRRIFLALLGNLLGAVILALVLAWTVGAQGPEPGEHEPHPGPRGSHPVHPMDVRLGEKPAPRPAPSGDLGALGVSAAVTVGQPGLSFRYVGTFGVTEVPYTSTTTHLNYPYALAVDGTNNVYIAEGEGHRVLKYDSAGNYQNLQIGYTGLCRVWDDWDNGVCSSRGLAVDSSGNIWVAEGGPDRVSIFTSAGTYTSQLGVTWEGGSDNGHFREPEGVAFDSAGRIYVADRDNNRVQIFASNRTYSATIGGTCGTGNNQLCQPSSLAMGSGDVLYVADTRNDRVQVYRLIGNRMVYSQSITTTGTTDLSWVDAVAVDANYLYVANYSNDSQVDVFSRGGVYSSTIDGDCEGSNDWFCEPRDVAVDSAGNVYVADDWENARVIKCSGGPNWTCTSFVGTYGVPYPTDNSHFNGPAGLAVGASLFVVEEAGQRLIKLNDSGVPQWTVGQAGVYGWDEDHFEEPGGVAVDSNGRSYVADCNRVQIFNSNGSYYAILGNEECSPDNGIADTEFCWPKGVAIGPGDAIYVADTDNHRVPIFDSNRVYQNRLGKAGVSGSDNSHFNGPMGVTVDASGNIYVADTRNHRVQVFNSSLAHSMTLGTTGEWGDDFDHFDGPRDVAVDSSGRIYVADQGNNRIQVFDSSGAYLTTIGGSWGSRTGELRGPWGVDVDSAGNVYVADSDNSRIQKFAPGVSGWEQVNVNGFGNRRNGKVLSLAVFSDTLYAGTRNEGTGGEIWRMGSPWMAVITGGLGYAYNGGIDHLIEFKGDLYAGTWADEVNGGEVWRSSNGLNWMRVVSQGFGDPTNTRVFRFAVFGDTLYASTWIDTDTHGTEVWRSNTGNVGDWTRVVTNGFGDADNGMAAALEVFNGYLYAGTNEDTGGEVWRTSNGTNWSQANADGFGDSDNQAVVSFAVFNGYLYAGTGNDTTGGQVWRCSGVSGCNGDSDWEQVVSNGFGSTDNRWASALIVSDNYLYCVTRNDETGVEVWRSSTGGSGSWSQVNTDGFGDSNNRLTYWDNAVVAGSLYVGTNNWANGGEVWQLGGGQAPPTGPVYLPIILKSYRP